MLAARCKAIDKYKSIHGDVEDGLILTKLVAYTSKLVTKYFFKFLFIIQII